MAGSLHFAFLADPWQVCEILAVQNIEIMKFEHFLGFLWLWYVCVMQLCIFNVILFTFFFELLSLSGKLHLEWLKIKHDKFELMVNFVSKNLKSFDKCKLVELKLKRLNRGWEWVAYSTWVLYYNSLILCIDVLSSNFLWIIAFILLGKLDKKWSA
jgi:hypothetical protein